MSDKKRGRLVGVIKQLAAEFIQKNINGGYMTTVTDVRLSDNMKKAEILVSILPDTKEEDALLLLKRARSDFKDYVKSHARLKHIPFFDFLIDKGEKNRQRLDELSQD